MNTPAPMAPMDPWYAVIGGPEPGVVQGYAEAQRRSNGHSGSYTKRGPSLEAAVEYYRRKAGSEPPEVHPLTPLDAAPAPSRRKPPYCRPGALGERPRARQGGAPCPGDAPPSSGRKDRPVPTHPDRRPRLDPGEGSVGAVRRDFLRKALDAYGGPDAALAQVWAAVADGRASREAADWVRKQVDDLARPS